MKQIIAVLDWQNFSASTARYASFLASSTNAHLTGVFLDDVAYHNYRIYHLLDGEGISESKLKQLNEKDDYIKKKSVKEFEKICNQAKIKYKVRYDRNIAALELFKESMYTDLVVIDRKETFSQSGESIPDTFLKDTLSNMESPVLVTPSKFKAFDKLILLYDGSPPSVHAIKTFAHLFDTFCSLPLEIVTVKQTRNYPNLSEKYLMNEWIKKYFSNVSYDILKGDPVTSIIQYAETLKDTPFFILGSRRRGRFSHWFHESMADTLIRKLQMPLFVERY